MVVKWIAALAIAAAIVAFFALGLHHELTIDALQRHRQTVVEWVDARPLVASIAFFSIYVAVTALSLPGAAVMTLAAGAVFGVLWGVVLVSFASSIGATFAFLLSRTLLRDWVQARFGDRLEPINRGFERDGAFYLFGLRMAPVFPFFVVNLVMGLTPMGVGAFYAVSQVGMLAGTFVFVLAGTQLATVHALGDVMKPGLIAAFTLLGLFPLVARKVVDRLRRSRGGLA
jgi:uncharacterized membrane protein YdjX (TVP38/TMEM64 family)